MLNNIQQASPKSHILFVKNDEHAGNTDMNHVSVYLYSKYRYTGTKNTKLPEERPDPRPRERAHGHPDVVLPHRAQAQDARNPRVGHRPDVKR